MALVRDKIIGSEPSRAHASFEIGTDAFDIWQLPAMYGCDMTTRVWHFIRVLFVQLLIHSRAMSNEKVLE